VTCREAERLIDTFFDGELEGRLMREAALHVTRCRRCETEIQDRELVHDLLKSSVEEEIAAIDLSAIWRGIEPSITVAGGERRGRNVIAFRLAAASTRVGNVLWGDRSEAEAMDDHGAERSSWLSARTASIAVLAASVALAVSLGLRESPLEEQTAARPDLRTTRIATNDAAPAARPVSAPVNAAPSSGTVRVAASTGPSNALVRPVSARAERRGGQVQIESVDSRAGAMAMWSVPTNDTAVIWLGANDPRASLNR
jgi:hypothetical protein